MNFGTFYVYSKAQIDVLQSNKNTLLKELYYLITFNQNEENKKVTLTFKTVKPDFTIWMLSELFAEPNDTRAELSLDFGRKKEKKQ